MQYLGIKRHLGQLRKATEKAKLNISFVRNSVLQAQKGEGGKDYFIAQSSPDYKGLQRQQKGPFRRTRLARRYLESAFL